MAVAVEVPRVEHVFRRAAQIESVARTGKPDVLVLVLHDAVDGHVGQLEVVVEYLLFYGCLFTSFNNI